MYVKVSAAVSVRVSAKVSVTVSVMKCSLEQGWDKPPALGLKTYVVEARQGVPLQSIRILSVGINEWWRQT